MTDTDQPSIDRSGAVCYTARCGREPTHRIRYDGHDQEYGICGTCADRTPVSRGTVNEGLTPETITTHPAQEDGATPSFRSATDDEEVLADE